MALILNLAILLAVSVVSMFIYDKFVHPLLFKEELEETLEDAVEEKTRKKVQKKAQQILEDDDVDSQS